MEREYSDNDDYNKSNKEKKCFKENYFEIKKLKNNKKYYWEIYLKKDNV